MPDAAAFPSADPRAILASLDPEQQQAVEAPRGPVAIIAGAGTGKTRTVTHRIAYLCATGQIEPRHVLAVTHSTKAAGELADRAQKLGTRGITARTFHSTAHRLLTKYWGATGRGGPLNVLSSNYAQVRRAVEAVTSEVATKEQVIDVASEIGWAKATLLSPARYPVAAARANRGTTLHPDVVAQCWERYDSANEAAGALDFEDLLLAATELIVGNLDVRAAVCDQYRCFVVDEYQDTDSLQSAFLDSLLNGRSDLCVVGDQRQSIYSWRGGDLHSLDRFIKRYPTATVVRLVRDYRSTPQIVDLANRLLPVGRTEALVGQRPAGPAPSAQELPTEGAEERFVASRVAALIAGGAPPNEIAVLYRFNAQSLRFEAALSRAGIPYNVPDSGRFFDLEDVRGPLRHFGQVARKQPAAPGADLLEMVLADYGFDKNKAPAGSGTARARWETHSAVLSMATAMPTATSAIELLAEINRRASEQHVPTLGGVTLATLHKAKGLEWDYVFLPSLNEGSLPSSYASAPGQIDEERRLFYVGITRARQELYLSWTKAKPGKAGAPWPQQPSRFLDELGVLTTLAMMSGAGGGQYSPLTARRASSLPAAPGTAGGHGTCAGCGDRLRGTAARRLGRCQSCLVGPDRELLEELCAWRSAVATELGLTDGAVATDGALMSVVARKPAARSDLSTIAGLRSGLGTAHIGGLLVLSSTARASVLGAK